MNSNMVKPEKFDLLHLVYHFTVPLTALSSLIGLCKRDILTFTFKRPYFFKKNMKKLVSNSLENYMQYVSCHQNL